MGELKKLRWPLVAASLIITILVLYAGNWALRTGTQDTPLSAFLSGQPAVAAFRLDRSAPVATVRVELRDVPRLEDTYRDLARGVERIAGPGRLELAVTDRRTPELDAAFDRVNPLLQEALATGRYGELVDRIEGRARGMGVDRVRVGIDVERVYLQMHQGPAYLYAVFPRGAAGAGVGPGMPAQLGGVK